jgi:hypothetical protein
MPHGNGMTPLEWKYRSPQSAPDAVWKVVYPIVLRALAWSIVIGALSWATVHVIAPSMPFPIAILAGATFGMPVFVVISSLLLEWASSEQHYRLDDLGLNINRARVLMWHKAIGYSMQRNPEEAMMLIARGGRKTSLPLPTEPVRTAVLQAINRHVSRLSSDQEKGYAVSPEFSLLEVVFFTVLAYVNALLAGYVLSILPVWFFRSFKFFLATQAFAGLPVGLVSLLYFRSRYPRDSFFQFSMSVFVMMFVTSWAGVFSIAFLTR